MTTEFECRCGECGVEFTAAPEGGHRLLCGDSTVATDVERVLTGITPHLMVTDPPYGVNYDPTWRNAAKFGDGLSHAGRASGKVVNDDRADWREAWALFPGDVAYIWHGGVHAGVVQTSLEVCGFTVRSQIIWAKSQLVISRGHYHAQHEPCFYAVRATAAPGIGPATENRRRCGRSTSR
jgi:DNA modification methylase